MLYGFCTFIGVIFGFILAVFFHASSDYDRGTDLFAQGYAVGYEAGRSSAKHTENVE